MLSTEDAKKFYDRFGAKQDRQAFYEDEAIDDLLAHMDLSHASVVYEFGCGTGRFAERILDGGLPDDARYRGVDLSQTMVELATGRLKRFGDRAQIARGDGAPRIDAPDGSVDAVVSNYVLDLLSPDDICAFLSECRRVLKDGGQLGLISLTYGTTPLSRVVMALWRAVFRLRPKTVGGCRPVSLRDYLDEATWQIVHRQVIVAWGIPSETVIVSPRSQ